MITIDNEDFVCVFGRNGSGKSCIVDAIAFCLGASIHQLRVKRLAELVNDHATEGRSFASVALGFLVVGDTNPHERVWVKCQVDSLTSQSRFFVGGHSETPQWKATSRENVNASLLRFGLDMRLQERFIIRQSNASNLAQLPPLDLLHFCERIIGTSNLKDQIAKVGAESQGILVAIQQTREKITSLNSEALECQPMVLKLQNWIQRSDQLNDDEKAVTGMLTRCIDLLLLKYDKHAEDVATKIAGVKREMKILEEDVGKCQEEVASSSAAMEALDGQVQRDKLKLSAAAESSSRLSAQVNSTKCDLAHHAKRYERNIAAEEKAARHLVAIQDKLKAERAVEYRLRSDIEELISESAALDSTLVNHEDSSDNTEEQIAQQRRRIKILTDRQIRVSMTANDMEKERRAARCELRSRKDHLEQLKEQLNNTQAELSRSRTAIRELDSAEQALSTQVTKAEAQLVVQVRTQTNMASSARADTEVESLQRRLGTDVVLGWLCNLAHVDPLYVVAVNSALRAVLSHLVVRDRQTGLAVARAFSDMKIGRVTCCVLDEIPSPQQARPRTRSKTADAIPLCDVLTYHTDGVQAVFERFGHRWMICNSVDEASLLIGGGNVNCVTIQGDLFYADGSIRACQRANNAGRSRYHIRESNSASKNESVESQPISEQEQSRLRHALWQLRVKREENHSKKQQVLQGLTSVEEQTEELKNQLQLEAISSSSTEGHLDSVEKSLKRIKDDERELEAKLECQAQALESLLSASRVSDGQAQASHLNRKRLALEHELESTQSQISSLQAKEAVLCAKVTELREKQVSLRAVLARHEEEITVMSRNVEIAEQQRVEASNNLSLHCEQLKRQGESKSSLRAKLNDAVEVLDNLKADATELTNEQRRNEQDIREADNLRVTCRCHLTGVERIDDEGHSTTELKELVQAQQNRLEKLSDEKRALESIKSSIAIDVVERAAACENEITTQNQRLEAELEKFASLCARQQELTSKRYGRLVSALKAINEVFVKVYRVMNEDGDCYLDYSLDRTALLNDGVSLKCKPDESHWQPFIGLSGGQQVVCAVSLMLALQLSFPSPFYVCDEIDAALDTVNVARLAALLRDQSRETETQFLVVSHRPEMWEASGFLVGVYERAGSAQAVVCSFQSST